MHFTTTVASALALILAASSTTVSAVLSPACTVCLLTTAIVVSPTCDADTLMTSNLPPALTPAERACLCPLASEPTAAWVQACIAPDVCVAEEVMSFAQDAISEKAAICADGGVAPPPPATSAPATSAPATSGAPVPPTTTGKPTTASNKPANATSAPPAPPKPTGKSGAAGSLFGSSDKVVAGAALAIASVAALLL